MSESPLESGRAAPAGTQFEPASPNTDPLARLSHPPAYDRRQADGFKEGLVQPDSPGLPSGTATPPTGPAGPLQPGTIPDQPARDDTEQSRAEAPVLIARPDTGRPDQTPSSETDQSAQHAHTPPPAPEPERTEAVTLTAPSGAPQLPPRESHLGEVYSIKKAPVSVRRADGSPGGMKTVPILVQNINGPCPLLALVNTIILSTSGKAQTPLIAALSGREDISLELLLNAVFDELTSTQTDVDELPDVQKLYEFLEQLHTGMNVNPLLILKQPGGEGESAAGRDSPLSTASFFEMTGELSLYSVFRIPLIHGWLPSPDSPFYAPLEQSAKTYEDAQVLLSLGDSLFEKFCGSSDPDLTEGERRSLENSLIIKDFFSDNSTQLTRYGLAYISNLLKPGRFCILFRNDHFSTLHKHASTGSLMTLVTDAGYASRPEVVWETLDISGSDSRYLSGDYREVGNFQSNQLGMSSPPRRSMLDVDTIPEQTVGREEQERQDRALALQLQQAEESRAREGARRGSAPLVPPRRASGAAASPTARDSSADLDVVPPPTYDQVARADQDLRSRIFSSHRAGHPPSAMLSPSPGHRSKNKEKCVVM